MRDRVTGATGDANRHRLGSSDASTRFTSMGLMWMARQTFLTYFENEMQERAAAIEAGLRVSSIFRQSLVMDQDVGAGYVATSNGQLHFIPQIRRVSFTYQDIDGVWYEITGFPDGRRPF